MSNRTAGPIDGSSGGDRETLVKLENLTKHFAGGSGLLSGLEFSPGTFPPITRNQEIVRAVDGVSLEIKRGETLGLVGESGCGKSTLGRTIIRLLEPTEGAIYINGENLADLSGRELRDRRSEFQMVLQDPQSSLNPRMRIGDIIEEPMKAHGMLDEEGREARAKELLDMVKLEAEHYHRFPHEFSGGQRQRVNLARALSVDPDFIVCDEPVSALDVSVQAEVLNTMRELQEELGLTYLFITHDLSVVRYICDRVAVMYLGRIVERASREELFEHPKHPYTQALLGSIPVPDPRRRGERSVIRGEVPSPIDPPSGCRFRTRCPYLIKPQSFDLSDEEWEEVRTFMHAVGIQSFEPRSVPEMRDRFFQNGVPPGEAGRLIEDVLATIAREDEDAVDFSDVDWETAHADLTEAFAKESVCATEQPMYTTDADTHEGDTYVACHLYDEFRDGESPR